MSDPKKTTPTITASEPDPNPNPAPAPKAGTSKQWKHTPPRIRVWEDQHSAEAAIVRDNEDDTLDLSADIYHTGRPIALSGVRRRVGLGNGWEEIDVAAEAKAQADAPHDERQGANAPKIDPSLVTLRIDPPFNGELKLGNSTYTVTDGVVAVPPWHVDDAKAAGYH